MLRPAPLPRAPSPLAAPPPPRLFRRGVPRGTSGAWPRPCVVQAGGGLFRGRRDLVKVTLEPQWLLEVAAVAAGDHHISGPGLFPAWSPGRPWEQRPVAGPGPEQAAVTRHVPCGPLTPTGPRASHSRSSRDALAAPPCTALSLLARATPARPYPFECPARFPLPPQEDPPQSWVSPSRDPVAPGGAAPGPGRALSERPAGLWVSSPVGSPPPRGAGARSCPSHPARAAARTSLGGGGLTGPDGVKLRELFTES